MESERMIRKEDLLDYINSAPLKKVRDYAKFVTALLDSKQLKILEQRTKKKVVFSVDDDEPEPIRPQETHEQSRPQTPRQRVEQEMPPQTAPDMIMEEPGEQDEDEDQEPIDFRNLDLD